MNLIILDLRDEFSGRDLMGQLPKVISDPARICRLTHVLGTDGPPYWALNFSDGFTIRTQLEPEGVVCATLLTQDRFDAHDELVILDMDCANWPIYFERLDESRPKAIDVVLSFEGDGSSKLIVDPEHTTVLRYTNGRSPSMAWYRVTKLYYDSARQIIRKNARWNGQFTFESLLRQLALQDTSIGLFSRSHDTTLTAVA
jgi:hypothetical protein